MTLVEHLAELRDRLVQGAVRLVLGTVVGYVVFPQLLDLLIQPYCHDPRRLPRRRDGNAG